MKTKLKTGKGQKIELKKLTPNIKNPRKGTYDKMDIEELKESLLSLGQITSMKVKTDGTIIGGHRRFQCMKELGWKAAFCDVVEPKTTFEESALMISDNTTQKSFNAMDFRKTINDIYWNEFLENYTPKNIRDNGYTTFAKHLGITATHVCAILKGMQKDNLLLSEKLRSHGLEAEAFDTIIRLPDKYKKELTDYAIKAKKQKLPIREAIRNKAYCLRAQEMSNDIPLRVGMKIVNQLKVFIEIYNVKTLKKLQKSQVKEINNIIKNKILPVYNKTK